MPISLHDLARPCLVKPMIVARIIITSLYVSHTQVAELKAIGTRFFTIGIGSDDTISRSQVSKIIHKTVLSVHK